MTTHWDRIVIGGGYSGLLAALRAQGRGERVLIIEASAECGGVLSPLELGGQIIDAGADSFSTAGHQVTDLLRELGLQDEIEYPHRSDARIIPAHGDAFLIPHGVLGIPSDLSAPEIKELFTPQEIDRALYLDSMPWAPVKSKTVAELVTERLGAAFVTKLVNPVLAGVHGTTADHMLATTTLSDLLAAFEKCGSLVQAAHQVRARGARPGSLVARLRGGMFSLAQIVEAVLRARGVKFRLGTPVTGLSLSNDNWEISSSTETFTAHSLSICTELEEAIRLTNAVSASEKSLSTSTTLVTVLLSSQSLNDFPLGSGALIEPGGRIIAKATTHVNAKWASVAGQLKTDQHIIRLSYNPDSLPADKSLGDIARLDLTQIYALFAPEITEMRTVQWINKLHQSPRKTATRVAALEEFAAQRDIELCGPYRSGNGLLGITRDHYQRMAA